MLIRHKGRHVNEQDEAKSLQSVENEPVMSQKNVPVYDNLPRNVLL